MVDDLRKSFYVSTKLTSKAKNNVLSIIVNNQFENANNKYHPILIINYEMMIMMNMKIEDLVIRINHRSLVSGGTL